MHSDQMERSKRQKSEDDRARRGSHWEPNVRSETIPICYSVACFATVYLSRGRDEVRAIEVFLLVGGHDQDYKNACRQDKMRLRLKNHNDLLEQKLETDIDLYIQYRIELNISHKTRREKIT